MRALDVRPVLTAHPTESTRRTLLALQARVADLLLARERAPEWRRREIAAELEARSSCSGSRPRCDAIARRCMDEVSTALWYLETRLLDAASRVRRRRCARVRGGVRCDELNELGAGALRQLGRAATATEIRSSRPT